MLTQSALDLAFPIAQALASRNVLLAGPGEDPITELAKISLSDLSSETINDSDTTASSLIATLHGTSKFQDESLNGLNGCRHDNVMAELVKNISLTVTNTIKTARNVAVPLINDCAEAAKLLLNDSAKAALYPYTSEAYVFPAMSLSPVLMDFIGNHRDMPMQNTQFASLPMEFGEDKMGSLINMSSTGIERYDAEIADWVRNNTAMAEDLFDGFVRSTNSLYDVLDMAGYRANERATFIYLLARKLQADGPVDGVNMELSQWRAYISGVAAFSAAAVHQTLNRRQRDIANKKLVLRWPPEGTNSGMFVLNGELLNGWCEAGGDIESLFGALYTDRDFTYDGLIANKERNIKEWNVQTRIYSRISAQTITGTTRRAMYDAIQPRVAAQFPDALTSARLHEMCEALDENVVVDLYAAVRTIVCLSVFQNTDVAELLRFFDEAANENPDADNRDVSLIAVTRYVGRWLAQILTPHAAS